MLVLFIFSSEPQDVKGQSSFIDDRYDRYRIEDRVRA